jgi:hypothetical protein
VAASQLISAERAECFSDVTTKLPGYNATIIIFSL